MGAERRKSVGVQDSRYSKYLVAHNVSPYYVHMYNARYSGFSDKK
jgi:hypothetical protein